MWFPGSQDCINIIVKYWFQCNGDKKLLVWMLEARLDTLSRNEIMIEACFSLCTATAGAQNNNLDLSPIKWSKMKVWTEQNFNLIEDGPGPDSHTTPIWMLLTAGCSLTEVERSWFTCLLRSHILPEMKGGILVNFTSHRISNTEISVMPVLTGNDLPNTALDSTTTIVFPRHYPGNQHIPTQSSLFYIRSDRWYNHILVREGWAHNPNMRNYSLCLVDIEPHTLRWRPISQPYNFHSAAQKWNLVSSPTWNETPQWRQLAN